MQWFRTRKARRRCSGKDLQTRVRIHASQGRADVFGDAARVPGVYTRESRAGVFRDAASGPGDWGGRSFWLEMISGGTALQAPCFGTLVART